LKSDTERLPYPEKRNVEGKKLGTAHCLAAELYALRYYHLSKPEREEVKHEGLVGGAEASKD